MDSFVKATAHAERELPTNMRRMQCLTVGRIVVSSKFQTCCPSPNCVAVARCQNLIDVETPGTNGVGSEGRIVPARMMPQNANVNKLAATIKAVVRRCKVSLP